MSFIDTHIHLTDDRYKNNDIHALLKANTNSIEKVITLGTSLADSIAAMDLAEKYPDIYFGAGVHPHDASEFKEEQLIAFQKLYDHKKCACVGEIGLDYHYLYSPKEKQIAVFIKFLELADQYHLPVSVHSREAEREVYNILKDHQNLKVVCHSYTGDIKTLEDLLSLGVYFSVNGMLTFKNNNNIIDIVERIPRNRLLFETDGPYLAPIPYRGKLNRPEYVSIIVEKAAEILNEKVDVLAEVTTRNAEEVFFCDL